MFSKSPPITWLAEDESPGPAASCSQTAKAVWVTVQGAGAALMSGVFFAFVALLFQFLGQSGIPDLQIIFTADLGMTIAMVPPLLYFRTALKPRSLVDGVILVSVGVIWTSGYVALLNALSRLPISNVIAVIHGAMPIMTPVLACVFLREFFTVVDTIGTAVNLAGIVLITQPTFIFGRGAENRGAQYPIGYLYAFLGALAFSVICILARVIGQRVSLLMLSFYKVAIGAIFALFLCAIFEPPVWKPQTPIVLAFLAMIVANTLGTWLRFRSLQLEEATTVVLLANIQLVMAYLLDFMIYKERPTAVDLTGALLIILSSAIVAVYTWHRRAKRAKQNDDDDGDYSFLYPDVSESQGPIGDDK